MTSKSPRGSDAGEPLVIPNPARIDLCYMSICRVPEESCLPLTEHGTFDGPNPLLRISRIQNLNDPHRPSFGGRG